jgi:hypothetical protein
MESLKKYILIWTLLISTTSIGQTSSYHSMPDSGAVWNFHYTFYCFWTGGGVADIYYSLTVSGDTIINGNTYHKLYRPYAQSFSVGNCGGVLIGYNGAFREDTSNRKVYYVPIANSVEQLLYDFNLQVGDTVVGYLQSLISPYDTVQSIDSILIGNSYRKRWNINPCYDIYLIEGIGSTYGLYENSPGCATDFANYYLTCFQQNGLTLYPDTTISCQLITISDNNSLETVSTTISPNPFHTSCQIQMSSEFGNFEWKIFNSEGILLTNGTNPNNKEFRLSRGDLKNGIYLIQLMNSRGQSVIRKFVVD